MVFCSRLIMGYIATYTLYVFLEQLVGLAVADGLFLPNNIGHAPLLSLILTRTTDLYAT